MCEKADCGVTLRPVDGKLGYFGGVERAESRAGGEGLGNKALRCQGGSGAGFQTSGALRKGFLFGGDGSRTALLPEEDMWWKRW